MKIDDVIAMRGRISRSTWEHEMLCKAGPRFEDAVFPSFRRRVHVREAEAGAIWERGEVGLESGLHRVESVICGVDPGYRHAFVSLWIAFLRPVQGAELPRTAWVFDELVSREQTVVKNAAAMRGRGPAGAELPVVYFDVAGRHMNSQTGKTDERVLREAGFATRARGMEIDEGIGLIGELLDPAAGRARLMIDPKCVRLIEAMEGYRRGADGMPAKDGRHDHLIDALRYALAGHERPGGKVETRAY